ncbi:MAG: sulfurtransferase TusA family protein [Alphaproteobacteria bacterium]
MAVTQAHRVLDTKGLNCPLPVLKARRTLREMAAGELLEVHATDPGAVKDFAVFAEMGGHLLVESRVERGVYVFILRKGAAS